jgi:AcrR family transcriptional regulator
MEILAEQGWAAITSRTVARRAGAAPGLINYHFGDLSALKREIASAAVTDTFPSALAVLTAGDDWSAGLAKSVRSCDTMTARQLHAVAELVVAATHDEQVATVVRSALAEARGRLVPHLAATGATQPEGLATLVLASLDGLVLHRIIDPELPLADVAAAAEADLVRAPEHQSSTQRGRSRQVLHDSPGSST